MQLVLAMCSLAGVSLCLVPCDDAKPLAMVTWTATLEMQRLNITEAMAWWQKKAGRVPERQMNDQAVYDYLLMHLAVKGLRNINKKLCKGHREILKKHFNLAESRQGMGKIKWGVERGPVSRFKQLKRRKRGASVASSINSSSTDVISLQTIAEHLKGHSGAALHLRAKEDNETTLDAKKPLLQEHSQAPMVSSILRNYDRIMPSPRPSSQSDGKYGLEETPAVLKSTERARINHQEGTNAKQVVGIEESLRSDVQESTYVVGSVHNGENMRSSVGFRVSKALELRAAGHSGITGSFIGSSPLPDSGENLEGNNISQMPPHVEQINSSGKLAPNQEILDEVGLPKVNDSEQFVKLRNHSQTLVSSEHLESKKNNTNPESTKQDEQGILTKDNGAINTNNIPGGISKSEIAYPKNSSTLSPTASEKGVGEEGTGKEQCNCLKDVNLELDLHSHQQAMAQAGILGNSKHIQGEQEVSRAAADMFIRTPRTEEAAWAAAALTFLFVLLTLAVLYTRLWRKFRKSESLYWAPGSDQEGQETVSAVIKRRLTVGQARRKKRQNYKKRPLVLYEDPSDSSD